MGIQLNSELFIADKPGLSAYAQNPSKGALSIVNLIQKTDSFIPKKKKAKTPLIVRATAGLRRLPPKLANNLLTHTRHAIS